MDKLAVSSMKGEVSLTIDLKKLLGLAQESSSLNGSNASFLDQLVKLGVSDAQTLSTINALENTQLQLKVSPTGDVAVTALRLDQFTLFPKLPLELRTRIWEEACCEPRIVEVDISTYPTMLKYTLANCDYTTRTPTPAVLHVCSEARKIGLKHYNRTFRRAPWFSCKDPKEHFIYVNFEQDTLYLSLGQQQVDIQYVDPREFGLIQQDVLYPETLRRIERIALRMPPQPDKEVYQYVTMLNLCTGLTEVIMVCGQGENGLAMKQEASMNRCPSGRKNLSFSEPPLGEKTSCEKFERDLRCRLKREQELVARNERLPPLITCKRLVRI